MSNSAPAPLLALCISLAACGAAPEETPSPTPPPAQATATPSPTPSPTPTLPAPSFAIDLAERENTSFIRNTSTLDSDEAPYTYESIVLTNMPGFEDDAADAAENYWRFIYLFVNGFGGDSSPEQCAELLSVAEELATTFAPYTGPDRYLILLYPEADGQADRFAADTTFEVHGESSETMGGEGRLSGSLTYVESNPWRVMVDTFDSESCAEGNELYDAQAVNAAFEVWSFHSGRFEVSDYGDAAITGSLSDVIISKSATGGGKVAGSLSTASISTPVTLVTTSD